MKNKKTAHSALHILLYPIFVLMGMNLNAQNCYIRMNDASGFAPSQVQLSELEVAACALIDSLPAAYRDSFRVFDFGFYLHNESMVGGYPEAFQQAITQVETQSQYYLLFGKQSDNTGIYSKFWVALKLPNQGIFYCIDQLSPSLRGDLTAKYGIIANAVHHANEKDYLRYHEAEMKTIDSLRTYVTTLKNCCNSTGQQRRGPSCTSCAFTPSEFGQNLVNNGFSSTNNQLKVGEMTSTEISADVIGRTNLILEVDGESIEIDKQISGIAERYVLNNPGKTIKIYLNRYNELCGSFDFTYNQFLNNGSDAKIFVVAIQYPVNQVKLYFYYDGELGVDEADAIEFVKGFPDHYFDLAGNYLGKDGGNWSRIRVINKPLSEVTGLYKDEAKKLIKKSVGEANSVDLSVHIAFVYGQAGDPNAMFSKIGGYYAAELGIFIPIVLSTGKNALAWVKPPNYDSIYIHKSPSLEFRDNYNELTNGIFHENAHITTKKGYEPCDHAKLIYLEQIKHASFSKCSSKYRESIIGSAACHIVGCWGSSDLAGGGTANTRKLTDALNSEIKKYGLAIIMKDNGPAGYECKVQFLKTGGVSPINCIDNEGY
jgi:hypothetical protein